MIFSGTTKYANGINVTDVEFAALQIARDDINGGVGLRHLTEQVKFMLFVYVS